MRLGFLLVNFDVYGNFPFRCNFQFKSQNKVRFVLERFLVSVWITFLFFTIFPISRLLSCLPRIMVFLGFPKGLLAAVGVR